jgi:hypothetical protein
VKAKDNYISLKEIIALSWRTLFKIPNLNREIPVLPLRICYGLTGMTAIYWYDFFLYASSRYLFNAFFLGPFELGISNIKFQNFWVVCENSVIRINI